MNQYHQVVIITNQCIVNFYSKSGKCKDQKKKVKHMKLEVKSQGKSDSRLEKDKFKSSKGAAGSLDDSKMIMTFGRRSRAMCS